MLKVARRRQQYVGPIERLIESLYPLADLNNKEWNIAVKLVREHERDIRGDFTSAKGKKRGIKLMEVLKEAWPDAWAKYYGKSLLH